MRALFPPNFSAVFCVSGQGSVLQFKIQCVMILYYVLCQIIGIFSNFERGFSMAKKEKKAKKKKAPLKLRTVFLLITLIAAIYGVLGYTFYMYWRDSQEVFHDVTVELGTESLSLRDFMNPNAIPERSHFVTDPAGVDLSRVGTTQLTLRHGGEESTVTLTVLDTTAPEATVEAGRTIAVDGSFPGAMALVSNVTDESDVHVSYATEPVIPEDYSPVSATVVLEDAHGNKTEYSTTFTFTGWLHESIILELGTQLTAEMVLKFPEKDSSYVNQEDLKAVSSAVGEHTLTVSTGAAEESCTVTVRDTTPPVLTLNTVRLMPGDTTDLAAFVSSATDLSGTPTVRMTHEMPDCSKQGTHTITVEAEDAYGNKTTRETTLWVSSNLNPPAISGTTKTLTMEKYSTPDFLAGVSARDDIDGATTVTVDTSELNNAVAGTYYITYSSMDSSGNIGQAKRKVEVLPNEEDTAALVAQIADTLPNDPEAIRDYVRDTIAYSSNWGGDDPTWYGLTKKTGNCYVHANTLQDFLEYKGYETQMIWVWNESHYWLIIKLDEGWRHIDSTPSPQHQKVSLMTDRDRYLNLNGRDWDRSKWPACE